MKRKTDYEDSSGNVFADLGFRNAKQELLKAKLTIEIYRLLKKRCFTQQQAANLLGTTQAQVSALMRCNPVSVSIGRLMEFLTVLGQDIEVTVKPAARRKAGDMSVVVQGAGGLAHRVRAERGPKAGSGVTRRVWIDEMAY